ncbi:MULTISPECIES: winged helix-turn-helix domain-containing protein [Niastella]|uniref:Winged helix-turn-helix domain-containing protein n=1 Tax=Niastella soli TaxID=2821487 RepID=A0ABS3YVP8_9BACT|nr:winged helix-turn-helix domain-containing protein [Niastella soli]MBO9202006.1 winged helix-turn-helix domain-containing protein [Niastella soli]
MKNQMKDILTNGEFRVNGSLWLEGNGTRFFGPGPVELLQLIDETGSINQAAKKMGMSYKKAWEIVNRLNEIVGSPLVITATGGEKGGGSAISEEAKQLIDWYMSLRERFRKFMEQETAKLR